MRSPTNINFVKSKSPIYFITFVTWERLELNSEARKIVLDSCLFFNEERYKLYAAIIMPDHVHLLIQPLIKNTPNNVSASILLASQLKKSQSTKLSNSSNNKLEYWSIGSILHSLKSYSAKQIPRVMNHLGKVWQDGRHDSRIRNQQEFNMKWEYIRQNPVKAKLVNKPEDYPFFWEMF
jgi:putative transposase